ncbi:dolichyl-phosphate-mannose--protein mannosyltransferase [Vibrio panuliri]|uniref:Dolichyl-phosphate-mannose--protein mannosyltransferase n=1 Tax=Vibrio panuliri TaxID=1381081 RepID=A0A1Q9HE99_9VIBR|nr:glycosyltransferase family 39 protein [Vibrio panuliri]OLQ88065.1 dolichyl-phosphate-mannose--protein mannosyltransferase [Vibrio panuliri]
MSFNRVHLWAILGSVLLIRLISLGAYPLMDTTEARYGEMARIMTETGNWLTPQFDYGVPFWGKPPLFTWMSASGIELFGTNEFAVRFPHWLAGVLVLVLMVTFARKLGFSGLLTAVVLATCAIFAISAGAVMTDMALTLGMSLAMVGFYRCWLGSRVWGYLGFVGLAIGLLAKGPLVVVLMGIAIVPWLILQHGLIGGFKVLWQRFPILLGGSLMLAIALPWYVMAEHATPGFLDYFIVGEHFKRFLVSGWQGDLYGTAHDEPRGTIWLFWLYSAAPWSLVLPILLWKKRHLLSVVTSQQKGIVSFLLCWMVSPLLLFTLSGNILPAYVLPGVPAIGLLIAILVSDVKDDPKWFKLCAGVIPVLLVVAVIVINLWVGNKKSDKVIFAKVDLSVPTFYVGQRPFSGQFYSQGKASKLEVNAAPLTMPRFQLIGKKDQVGEVVQNQALNCVVEFTASSERTLYRCSPSSLVQ